MPKKKLAVEVGKAYLTKDGKTVYWVSHIDCNRQGRLQVWYVTLTQLGRFAPAMTLSRFTRQIQSEAAGWDFPIKVLQSQGQSKEISR